jgi:GNAT superfamily N-acetyltransferase
MNGMQDAHPVTLRAATPDDALCIGVLATQVFLDTYATEGIRPAIAREALATMAPEVFAPLLADPANRFILAERLAHLIGFVQWKLDEPHAMVTARRPAELQRLYVQERFSSTGVGTRLLRAAEADAAKGGADLMWLTAWSGNARARAYYPRRGYVDAGTTSYSFEGETFENRLFVRPLDAVNS